MSNLSLTVVCLPQSTPVDRLADTAASRLARASLAAVTTAAYFLTKGYFHRGSLLQAQGTTAAGGPITLLDLDAMRAGAHSAHWNLWQLWNQVVAGTRPALPYWTFLQHHRDDPQGYPLTVAQQQYLAQPRIAAMRTYNALPAKAANLPTSHLEAFQINEMSYANFGLLHAVPGNSLLTVDGDHLQPRSDRYLDQLDYLDTANRAVAALAPGDNLVAFSVRRSCPTVQASRQLSQLAPAMGVAAA